MLVFFRGSPVDFRENFVAGGTGGFWPGLSFHGRPLAVRGGAVPWSLSVSFVVEPPSVQLLENILL